MSECVYVFLRVCVKLFGYIVIVKGGNFCSIFNYSSVINKNIKKCEQNTKQSY